MSLGSAGEVSDEIAFKTKSPPYSDVLGARRIFAGLGILEWFFLSVSTLNITATIGFTITIIIKYHNEPVSADFTFAVLLLVNAVFCLFYVYNGVLREQTFEVVTFLASVVLVLCYCIFEYAFNVDMHSPIKLARLIVSCILAPLNLFLAIKVIWQFGWLEFNIVGASEALQKMFRQRQAFYSLQKFDLQAAVSVFILTLHHGQMLIPYESLVLSLGLVISLIWMLILRFAVSKEMKKFIWFLGLFGFVEPAFVVARVAKTYDDYINHSTSMPATVLYSLLAVGAVSFLVRAILLVELIMVYKHFQNGLGDTAFHHLIASESTGLISGRQQRRNINICTIQ